MFFFVRYADFSYYKNIVVITLPREKKEETKGEKGKSVPSDLRDLKRDFQVLHHRQM